MSTLNRYLSACNRRWPLAALLAAALSFAACGSSGSGDDDDDAGDDDSAPAAGLCGADSDCGLGEHCNDGVCESKVQTGGGGGGSISDDPQGNDDDVADDDTAGDDDTADDDSADDDTADDDVTTDDDTTDDDDVATDDDISDDDTTDDDSTTDDDVAADDDDDEVIEPCVVLPEEAEQFAVCPKLCNVRLKANPYNTLSTWVRWETDKPAVAHLEYGAEMTPSGEETTTHEMLAIGFTEGEAAQITAVSSAGGCETAGDAITFNAGPLPPDFVRPTTVTLNVDESLGHWSVYGTNDIAGLQNGPDGRQWLVVMNEHAEPIWYHQSPYGFVGEIKHLADGTFLYNNSTGRVIHVGLDGRELEAAEYPGITHDFLLFDDGGEMILELAEGTGPGCEGEPSVPYVGTKVSEHNAAGDLIWSWNIFDHPDKFPPSIYSRYDMCDILFYKELGLDWTHHNSIYRDMRDDSIVISSRHLDAIFKVSHETGDVVWRFGIGRDFTYDGPEAADDHWTYHQHDARFLPNGNLLVFDNGNGRGGVHPSTGPYSRAVEYTVDEENLTAHIAWEHRIPYSLAMGSAQRLDNGNTLLSSGLGVRPNVDAGVVGYGGMVIETTPDETELLRMEFAPNVAVYRVRTLDSLWPTE